MSRRPPTQGGDPSAAKPTKAKSAVAQGGSGGGLVTLLRALLPLLVVALAIYFGVMRSSQAE